MRVLQSYLVSLTSSLLTIQHHHMLFDWANTIFEMLTRLKFWHNEKESTTGGQVAPSPQPVGNDSREQPAASSVTTFVTGINVVYEPKITNEATVE